MALDRPRESWVWMKIPKDEAVELLILGEVHTWYSHWMRPPGGRGQVAVRCVAEEAVRCDWCAAGFERRPRYVFPVRYADDVRLLELGAPQYGMLSLVYHSGRWIGSRILVVRERPQMNAPIQLRPSGHERLPPEMVVDCEEYVGTLGRGQLVMLRDHVQQTTSANGKSPHLRGSGQPVERTR